MELTYKGIKMEQINKDFMKYDTEKNRLELIEPAFIEGLGAVLTMGAKKYAPNNWKNATEEDRERIKGALLRHIMAYLKGDRLDAESGESHLYHASFGLMVLDYFDRKDDEKDNVAGLVQTSWEEQIVTDMLIDTIYTFSHIGLNNRIVISSPNKPNKLEFNNLSDLRNWLGVVREDWMHVVRDVDKKTTDDAKGTIGWFPHLEGHEDGAN